MEHLQVPVDLAWVPGLACLRALTGTGQALVVAYDGVAAGVEGQGGVLPNISCSVGRGDRVAAGAGGIAAVKHLQVPVGDVIVGHYRVAGGVQGYGRVLAYVAVGIGGANRVAARAGGVSAVEHLQVPVEGV